VDEGKGFHSDKDNVSTINAALTDMTNGSDIVEVTVHETTHHILNEQNNGYASENKENAAKTDGEYANTLWQQQNDKNGNITGGSATQWRNDNSSDVNLLLNTLAVNTISEGNRENLLPVVVRDAQTSLREFQKESQEASAALKGDAIGTEE